MLHWLFADCHVHFHACFQPDRFFRAAILNFQRAAGDRRAQPRPWVGYLFLTETGPASYFSKLSRIREKAASPKYKIEETDEEQSVVLRSGELELFLVAGTQTQTKENLEVSALGRLGTAVHGQSLRETIDEALSVGAIPIIPWGFGKWWWERGRMLRAFLETVPTDGVYLGDNGGRLALSKTPALFSLVQSRHRFVLAGSDPLPFPQQVTKPGSYGSVLEGHLNRSRPFESFVKALKSQQVQPPSFGELTGFGSFFLNQFRMQLLKRGLS